MSSRTEINRTHQLLVYADDIILLKKYTQTLIDVSRVVGLEVNSD
jgi:hypothetical protein